MRHDVTFCMQQGRCGTQVLSWCVCERCKKSMLRVHALIMEDQCDEAPDARNVNKTLETYWHDLCSNAYSNQVDSQTAA